MQEAERIVNEGKAAQAETACRAILRDSPDLPAATALLGFIVARRRRYQEAEALLRAAIAKRPDVPHWHFELRNILRHGFRSADWRRSVPLAGLRELASIPGVRLVSLQKPVPEAEHAMFAELGLLDFSADLTDFGETAAVIANLDLVVLVDSAVAHLAAAMGVSTWTLIYKPADWRWMTRREDSPWYPTMRLLRQPRAGQWDKPIQRVIGALRQYMQTAQKEVATRGPPLSRNSQPG